MTDNLYLVYVNYIGKDNLDKNIYEFYFSTNIENVWGEDWDFNSPSQCEDLRPEESTYSEIKRLTTDIPFFCAQNNSCFPFSYCIDGIMAIAFEDISNYDDYPEPFRLVFHFGDSYVDVIDKLQQREQQFDE